jgi:hypothetical protein
MSFFPVVNQADESAEGFSAGFTLETFFFGVFSRNVPSQFFFAMIDLSANVALEGLESCVKFFHVHA